MPIQRVARQCGVREKCMSGVGATPPSRLLRRLTPRWSLPPPACLNPMYRVMSGLVPHLDLHGTDLTG